MFCVLRVDKVFASSLIKSCGLGFALIVNDFLGVFRDSNSQLFGDYSIYLLGINDYLDDYLGKKVTIRENPIQLGDLWSI